jgi:hypothetical protein
MPEWMDHGQCGSGKLLVFEHVFALGGVLLNHRMAAGLKPAYG